MRLHQWDGRSGRTWFGLRARSAPLAVASVRDAAPGALVEHCADDLPKRVCRSCARGFDKRLGGRSRWWWRRAGGGKWLAIRLIPAT